MQPMWISCWLITSPAFLFIPLPAAEPTHPRTSLFDIAALCFPHAVTNVLLIAVTQLVHRPPPFPYRPLHPHTSAVNRGVRVGDRKECGGVRGVRLMKVMVRAIGQRGTVYPLSPCERETAGSVCLAWPGLLHLPLSLPLSLSLSLSLSHTHFLPLCPRSCFSLSLLVLAGTQWHLAATRSPACARADTHASRTHMHAHTHFFVCLGSDQVPLSRASKRQRSAEHTTLFTFAEHGHTHTHTHPRPYACLTKPNAWWIWTCTPGENILPIFTPDERNLTLATNPGGIYIINRSV